MTPPHADFKPMSAVRIDIAPPATPNTPTAPESDEDSIEIDDAWDTLKRAKPRLFDGPILAFLSEEAGLVRARRDSYKRLVVQTEAPHLIDPPVMQLSVTGILVARDRTGAPSVFLGQRSEDTRIYGSLWELGPSGGLDPPPAHVHTLDEFAVIRQLQVECRDEVGIPGVFTSHDVLGLIHDPVAMSTDIVVRLDLQRPVHELIASASNWEYAQTRWVPATDLVAFGQSQRTIPPTAKLIPIVAEMLT